MKMPWSMRTSSDARLVVGLDAERFVYAQAAADGRLQRCGVEDRGSDSMADFARRLRGLGLPAQGVCAVLPLAQAQFVQVDAPAVRPEELRAAARWSVKDRVEGRLDELALDVLFVGDDKPRPNRQIFVAAARQTLIREAGEFTRAAGLELAVVDIAETAQRNLQCGQARHEGLAERATAALVRHDEQCLLTICAGDELYYARRLDWQGQALPVARRAPTPDASASLDFVDYGAEDDGGMSDDGEVPALVMEVQRSFDVWDRSWPDLPLAALWVQVGEDSQALALLLSATLGQPVGLLDPAKVFSGYAGAAPTPALRSLLLPVLGGLLRSPGS